MERLIKLTKNKSCLTCKICCRFSNKNPNLKPSGLTLKKYNDLFICSNFDPDKTICRIYAKRPFDCKIYPFVIAKSEDEENILLAIDNTCPNTEIIIQKLSNIDLNIKLPIIYIVKWEDTFIPIKTLKSTNSKFKIESLRLNKLNINHRIFFNQFLYKDFFLSAYTFAYHFIWENTTKYFWKIIDDSFCLFAKNGNEIFMPIPPLNPYNNISEETLKKCFKIMNFYNKNKEISRIENVSKETLYFLTSNEFKILKKDEEYIYKTENLATLKGDKYKSIRWLYNVFQKQNKYLYKEYNDSYLTGCINLLNKWINEKFNKAKTNNEKFLLQHTVSAHKQIFINYKKLGLIGRVVVNKVNEDVVAYTFGGSISPNTFCIFVEVSNLDIKGASQFIFKEFCSELKRYKYINTMGDEGIENLRFTKLLYRPSFKESNYTIIQK